MIIFLSRQSDLIIKVWPKEECRLLDVVIGGQKALQLKRVTVNTGQEKRKKGGQKNEDEIYVLESKGLTGENHLNSGVYNLFQGFDFQITKFHDAKLSISESTYNSAAGDDATTVSKILFFG